MQTLEVPGSKSMKGYETEKYNTEDGVKFTCRYDIQIDNEKEF